MITLKFDVHTCEDYFYYAHQIYSLLYETNLINENNKISIDEWENKSKKIIIDNLPIKNNDYIQIESSAEHEIYYMKIDDIDVFPSQSNISLTLYGQIILANFKDDSFSYDKSSYYETTFDISNNIIELDEITLINKEIFYDLLNQCEVKIKNLLK